MKTTERKVPVMNQKRQESDGDMSPPATMWRWSFALFGAAMVVLSLLVALPATRAKAAEPEVSATLQRLNTGTGHGTADRCAINSKAGFKPGDDSPDDDFVCTKDTVGYRFDMSVKSDDNPSSFTLVFKLHSATSSQKISNFGSFCVSRPGQWTATGGTFSTGEEYCNIKPQPNLNLSYRFDFNVLIDDADAANLDQAEVRFGDKTAVAPGYTVLSAMRSDLRARFDGGPYYSEVDGKGFLGTWVAIDVVPLIVDPGASNKKGAVKYAKNDSLSLDLTGAPEGTKIGIIETFIGQSYGTAMTLDNNFNGYRASDGSNYVYAKRFQILTPYDPAVGRTSVNFDARVSRSTSPLTGTAGQINMAGSTEEKQPQIGQKQDCTESTDGLGGATARAGLPNNDCVSIKVSYDLPSDNYSKSVDPTDYSDHVSSAYDSNGDKKNVRNGVKVSKPDEDASIVSTVYFRPLPGEYPLDLCDRWDATQQYLNLDGRAVSGRQWLNNVAIDPNDYDIYYSNLAAGIAGCGDASSLTGWYNSADSVPGGRQAVNALRIKLKSKVRTTDGVSFSIPFKIRVENLSFDSYGVSNLVADTAFATTGRAAGWGPGAAGDISVVRPFLETSVQVFPYPGNVKPGDEVNIAVSGRFESNGYSGQATPRFHVTLPACAAPRDLSNGSVEVDGRKWFVAVRDGESAGVAGCEDDVPYEVTFTSSEPLNSSVLSAGFYIPVRISPVALQRSLSFTATSDVVEGDVPISKATASNSFSLNRQSAVLSAKAVDRTRAQRGESLNWTLGFGNTLSIPINDAQWIDVLPFDGDAAGTKTSGRTVLDSVALPDGVSVEYSKTAPTQIVGDPRDASNAAGGSTVWCSGLSGGACPAAIGEVTALRFTADMPEGTDKLVGLKAHVVGGKDQDVVVNKLGLGVSADLKEPVPSPDAVTTTLFDSSFTGKVFSDKNRDGVLNDGESGIAQVRVQAIDANGDVAGETETDADGQYKFANFIAGTYRTRIVDGQDVLKDTELTASFENNKGTQASMTSTDIVLGLDTSRAGVDFGFHQLEAAGVSIAKQVRTQDGSFAETAEVKQGESATWQIEVKNTGDRPLSHVEVRDELAGQCARTIDDLAVGASQTFECISENVQTGFTNTAVVTAQSGGTTVQAEDTAKVTLPAPPVPSTTESTTSTEPSTTESTTSSEPTEPTTESTALTEPSSTESTTSSEPTSTTSTEPSTTESTTSTTESTTPTEPSTSESMTTSSTTSPKPSTTESTTASSEPSTTESTTASKPTSSVSTTPSSGVVVLPPGPNGGNPIGGKPTGGSPVPGVTTGQPGGIEPSGVSGGQSQAAQSGSDAGTGGQHRSLARTGAAVSGIFAVAVLLLAAGALLVMRRRRDEEVAG